MERLRRLLFPRWRACRMHAPPTTTPGSSWPHLQMRRCPGQPRLRLRRPVRWRARRTWWLPPVRPRRLRPTGRSGPSALWLRGSRQRRLARWGAAASQSLPLVRLRRPRLTEKSVRSPSVSLRSRAPRGLARWRRAAMRRPPRRLGRWQIQTRTRLKTVWLKTVWLKTVRLRAAPPCVPWPTPVRRPARTPHLPRARRLRSGTSARPDPVRRSGRGRSHASPGAARGGLAPAT